MTAPFFGLLVLVLGGGGILSIVAARRKAGSDWNTLFLLGISAGLSIALGLVILCGFFLYVTNVGGTV